MAGLKRILNVEKASFQPTSPDYVDHGSPDSPTVYEHSPEDPVSSGPSPEPGLPSLPQMRSHTFLGIEKQFEELHDQFRLRQSPSISSKRYKYIQGKPRLRNKRHVDVLEAIFSSQRRLISTPITPTDNTYNEDIANRNLRPTLSTAKNSSPYTRLMSTMYQEDIADRNLLISGSDPPSRSVSRHDLRVKGSGSRDAGSRRAPRCQSELANRTDAYDEHHSSALRVISSDNDLKNIPALEDHQTEDGYRTRPTEDSSQRSQSSAPVLSPSFAGNNYRSSSQLQPASSAERQSDIPVDIPSYTARNECASIPEADHKSVSRGTKSNELQPANRMPLDETPGNRLLSPNPVKSVARKNIHALSINTTLAEPRKNFVKVKPEPAEPQVPTPRKDCASIAEVANSPVSTAASTGASPPYKVEDIMNLFKKAYCSTETTTTSHPTFETLQDAIVREINSHDAFRQINSDNSTLMAPELSPDLTSDDCAETQAPAPEMSKTPSRRSLRKQSSYDKQPRKLTRKKQRCSSDMHGRELSFPAIKGIESKQNCTQEREKKRRHTYAQPPSLDLVESYDRETQQQQQQHEATGKSHGHPTHKRQHNTSKSSDHGSSENPGRPHTSHAFVSKAMSAILDPTSDSSKRPQSRSARQTSSRMKLASGSGKATSGPREPGSQSHQPPEIQVDHASEKPEQRRQGKKGRTKSTSQPSSSTPSPSPGTKGASPARPPASHRASKTASMPSTVKKSIPIRKSSIQKDMYDSGRFRI